MKPLFRFAIALLLAAGAPALADDQPAATMARILAGMNHFPSAEQKAELTGIAGDEAVDADLRAIAGAISSIEHKVGDKDRAKLQAILGDKSASEAEKTLAGAVIRFNHKVADDDAAALASLTD
jgi:hypothetical protein